MQVKESDSEAATLVSLGLDILPIIGSMKSFCEVIRGKDLVTDQDVSRWLAAGGIIIGLIPFGKVAFKMQKARKIARGVAFGVDKNRAKLISELEEKILSSHPLPLGSNPSSRYQYELLRKQLRLEEGMIAKSERVALGGRNLGEKSKTIGGHAYADHSLSSKGFLHSTGELRTQVGHDYGRFGREWVKMKQGAPIIDKNTGSYEVGRELYLLNKADEFYAVNSVSALKDIPWKTSGDLGLPDRKDLYNFIYKFLMAPSTKPILRNREVIGYEGKAFVRGKTREVKLYQRVGHEGTIYAH
jgi:hypothetical protein